MCIGRVWRYQREVIRIRILKKNRHHNGQKKKYKRTNNDLQNIYIYIYITKDRVTRTPLKTGSELRCSGRVSSSCSSGVSCCYLSRQTRWSRSVISYCLCGSTNSSLFSVCIILIALYTSLARTIVWLCSFLYWYKTSLVTLASVLRSNWWL